MSNKPAVQEALKHAHDAVTHLQRALALISQAAPSGHDATVSVYEARRAAEVAEEKLKHLERRTP